MREILAERGGQLLSNPKKRCGLFNQGNLMPESCETDWSKGKEINGVEDGDSATQNPR